MKERVNPPAFAAAVRPYVARALAHVDAADREALMCAVICEAAVETGWRPDGVPTPAGEPPSYNLTGIADARGVPVRFPSLDAWAQAEARALALPAYREVLAGGDVESICRALGASPWAAGHYVGTPPDFAYPGGSLVAVWRLDLAPVLAPNAPSQAPAPAQVLPQGEWLEVHDEGGRLRVEEHPASPGG